MALTRLPIDADALGSLSAAGPVAPVYVFSDDRNAPRVQDANADGVPMWRVEVLLNDGTAMTTQAVKFPASQEPAFALGAPLRCSGLSGFVSVSNGRAVVYLSAASVSAAASTKPAQG